MSRATGTITLMGSGEMTESMSRVHRWVMSKINGPVRAVFLDTPAGFELNADNLSHRAVDYLRHHFGISCTVASFRSRETASEREVRSAVRKIEQANYIFAGPGSPTYAIKNWRDTPVWEAVVRRVSEGAHLVLASAAAIALGRYSLPVYEIYKVGEDVHWVDGLDLVGAHGLELAIVTHWNNMEGGTYDTRFCYMGEPRFRALEQSLPSTTTVLGIDEYTACILDLASNQAWVMAAGQVTVRRQGEELIYPSGESFGLDEIKGRAGRASRRPAVARDVKGEAGETLQQQIERAAQAVATGDGKTAGLAGVAEELYELAEAVDRAEEAGVPEKLLTEARGSLGQVMVDWSRRVSPSQAGSGDIAPFVEMLLEVRSRLREMRQWALADEIRDRLSALGVVVEDRPEGTGWRRPA
jgi:cyanophycinase-like exopeptidase